MSSKIKADLEKIRRALPAPEAPEDIVHYADKVSGHSVIDIGGGEGSYSYKLKIHGRECLVVDIDPVYLKRAKSKGLMVARMSADSLAIRDEAFDTALLVEVVEHLADPEKALKEAKRVARQNVFITTPSHDTYFWLKDRTLFTEGSLPPDHLHFFTKPTLENLLASIFPSYRVLYGEPIRLFDFVRPVAFRRLYSEACTSDGVAPHLVPDGALEETFAPPDALSFVSFREPLGRLLLIYMARPDLQAAFPEVQSGDYFRLVDWARAEILSGSDSVRSLSAGDIDWYEANPFIQLRLLENQIHLIHTSLAWKLVTRYRTINDKLFPVGTRRRKLIDQFANALTFTIDEGLRNLIGKTRDRYTRVRTLDEQYQVWLQNNLLDEKERVAIEHEISRFEHRPKISIVMPVHNTQEEWLRSAIESVLGQYYTNWELCIADDASTNESVSRTLEEYATKDPRIRVTYLKERRGISCASNEALGLARGEFVGFLDHDDELTRDALFEVAKLLNQHPSFDLVYSDEDKLSLDGRRVEPFFKPDWSPDLLMSMNYISHFTIIRKQLVDKIGGFRLGYEGSQDYDLILRVTELTDKIAHIPKPLYSWRKVPGSAAAAVEAKPYARESTKAALQDTLNRRGLKGQVTDGFGGYYHVKYEIEGSPLISIIIPTKDRVDLLKRCIDSIESSSTYKNLEIIVVDNLSTDPETLEYLGNLRHTVLKFDEPFNFSRINNLAVKHAGGEHLVFLNNDTEVVQAQWLEAMLTHSRRPEVGIVGALLLYPSKGHTYAGKIQHAGVILGIGGVAGHAFKYLAPEAANYFNLHRVVRNYSAVTAACAMIRRSVFEEVGGFDEKLKVAFGDIDLCLRVTQRGYRIVYTPYAQLYHYECATRGSLHPSEDDSYMTVEWSHALIQGDPYYNRNLTHLREDFSIAPKGHADIPLAVLLEVYYQRPNLRNAFPEARQGDYRRLMQWAAEQGITHYSSNIALRPYRSYFIENSRLGMKAVARKSLGK